jgi:ornithine racemase
MAFLKLDRNKLKTNYSVLDALFKENDIEWSVVSKLLCGHKSYLEEIIKLGPTEICDARVSNLKTIKHLAPNIQTVYIKPPAKRSIPGIVKYADVSFNTELQTIRWLSAEAVKQNKIHKIVIMIELGDLREGVMGEKLIDFYGSIFQLPNISISGLGANLNCLSGVYPSEDKLIQLSLYKQLIEARFNKRIPWVTGGTSVVIPMLLFKQVPKGINHFRVGETLFFGNNLISNEVIPGMEEEVFKLYAEIIEIADKPRVPIGYMGENPSGETVAVDEADYGKTSYRAVVDLGVLDVSNPKFLTPDDENIDVVGASSDMIVLDLGNNDSKYKVGDLVSFNIKYMGALRVLNSNYIDKIVE